MTLPTTIAVIGAGTMGAGIAQIFAQAGHSVRLQARKRETLEAALRRIRLNQDELIRHGLLEQRMPMPRTDESRSRRT